MPFCLHKSSLISKLFFASVYSIIVLRSNAQNPYHFQVEAQTIATSNEHVPFWMRARQGGAAPLSGLSGSLVGNLRKDYDTTRRKLFDWGVVVEGRANAGKETTELYLVQANAKLKLGIFEIRGGRWREQIGLVDTLLSSGAFSVSDNALGIPQVEISIPQFYPLPFTKGWVAFKGNFSHGWMGNVSINPNLWVDQSFAYFHRKSLYGRFGRPTGLIRLYGGFNHQAFWGNERTIFGANFTLNDWQSYQSVLYGKMWAGSKVGNHLGSIDLGLELNLHSVQISGYRQFFYEVGALAHFANVSDGITGLSIRNKRSAPNSESFHWKKFLIEVVYSKNQAGALSSKPTPSGAENYYNHYLYTSGWTYKGFALGNPLFTLAADARDGQTSISHQPFINNRLIAIHGGLAADVSRWNTKLLLTYSSNYGTYATSGKPYRTPYMGIEEGYMDRVFSRVQQFSGILAVQRDILGPQQRVRKLTHYWGGQLAIDSRGILDSSYGVNLKYGIRF
jgi:hypothetical protein